MHYNDLKYRIRKFEKKNVLCIDIKITKVILTTNAQNKNNQIKMIPERKNVMMPESKNFHDTLHRKYDYEKDIQLCHGQSKHFRWIWVIHI